MHLQGKSEASKIGLTKEGIETAVRSRLRGARIFKDDLDRRRSISPPPKVNGFLQVSVTLTAASLGMSMRFEKVMTDEASGYVGWTPTGWWRGLLGGHADDGYYVLSAITPEIDGFIDDYLRVNEVRAQSMIERSFARPVQPVRRTDRTRGRCLPARVGVFMSGGRIEALKVRRAGATRTRRVSIPSSGEHRREQGYPQTRVRQGRSFASR